MAGESRNNLTRILFAGVVMIIVGIALLASLAWRPEHVKNILITIAVGVRYLLRSVEPPGGTRRRRSG